MRNMRTLLRLMGTITLSTTAASSVVACKPTTPPTPDTSIDLTTIITTTKLGQIMMVGSTPTNQELLTAIKESNTGAQDLSLTDFELKPAVTVTTTSATIIGTGNYKGEIPLTYTKDKRKDLTTIITTTKLGQIMMVGSTPTNQELLTAIKESNTEAQDLSLTDFELKPAVTVTTTSATIIGTGNYKGEIPLTYTKDKRKDLTTIITTTKLGQIMMVGSTPTNQELLTAIKESNTGAQDLSLTDFELKPAVTVTTTSATIIGTGNYKGEIPLTYTKDKRKDLTTIITTTKLGQIMMVGSTPTNQELLTAIKESNTEAQDLSLTDFELKPAVTVTTTSATIIGTGNYKGEIPLTYTKDKRKDLTTIITTTKLGQIMMVGSTPTNQELLTAIKESNTEAQHLPLTAFELKSAATDTNVTIVGTNDHKGEVNLTYTKDKRKDLTTIITTTKLGQIMMVGSTPTNQELLTAIKESNTGAQDLSLTDFELKSAATDTNVTIVGTNDHKGEVNLTYTKDTRTDLSTITNLTGFRLISNPSKLFKDFDLEIIKATEFKTHPLASDYTLNYYLSRDETKLIDKNTRKQDPTGIAYIIISAAKNDPNWKGATDFIMITINER